jgi:DNA-directed RNA polymerase specialized sigma24 family protein
MVPQADAETFEAHRDLMFAVAYRMLGTVADAEDAVQDAWLSWSAASRGGVTDPRRYLVKVITNTSLNRLRAAVHPRRPGPCRRDLDGVRRPGDRRAGHHQPAEARRALGPPHPALVAPPGTRRVSGGTISA